MKPRSNEKPKRLLKKRQQEEAEKYSSHRRSLIGSGGREEKIRTYNFPQGRVTEHRIGLTLYKLEQIMEGALDEVVEALSLADQSAKLQAVEG